jgi:hypothetical protein
MNTMVASAFVHHDVTKDIVNGGKAKRTNQFGAENLKF